MSLHGLMAGVGFVVGAILMLREARRRGFDEVKITSVLTWALVGSILGARLFTVPAHLDEGLIEAYRGTVSVPFEPGTHKRIAVKIVDDRGIESLKIIPVP